MDCIGFICDADHPMFHPVAERLAARGFEIDFLHPAEPIGPADVDSLSALASGVVHPSAFAALQYADRTGVPTWNGFLASTALSARLVTLDALSSVGCRVPSVRFDGPREGFVPGYRYAWEGATTLEGAAPFYVESLGDGPTHRYYAVDDGRETHMRALSLQSAISDDERVIERTDVDVSLAASVRELLDELGARAIAVDFRRAGDGRFYALRATPTPTFTGAGMDRRVADSVASLTTIGA